jgi:hypothetical protein
LIVAVHQPQYLPWLGYFDKIRQSDAFCLLDNVQYKKNEWQNRNRIKTAQGWQWLTVPVHYKFPQKISEIKINHQVRWRKKHLQALKTNYKKARFFSDYFDLFEDTLAKDWVYLSELNAFFIKQLLAILDIPAKPLVLSSGFTLSEDPTDRLIDICKALGGTAYLSGQDGAKYMDMARFKERNIRVVFQKFEHPTYTQLFGDFISHLSVVDLLFNCGPDSLKQITSVKPKKQENGT